MVLQVKPVTVRVQIGRPITTESLGTSDPRAIHQAVLAEMTRLFSAMPAGGGLMANELNAVS